jgi:MYXO-CTERM domain-containing protein
LLPTCTQESPESGSRQSAFTPRIFKPAPPTEVATWQRVTSTVAPDVRFLQAVAFDETRGVVVMFGGMTRTFMSGAHPLQDTWEWSPATGAWTLRRASGPAPADRGGAAMAYDPVRKKVLMFGGRAASGYDYEDLWEWDPPSGEWTDRTSSGKHPAARAQHAMLYQKSTNKILLFGGGRSSSGGTSLDGTGVSASIGDTWELDSATATWTMSTPATGPSARHDFGFAWDSTNNKAVLFGGLQVDVPGATGVPKQDTWEWDPGAQTWTDRTSMGDKPAARMAPAMAYDDTRKRVVLFGGVNMPNWDNQNDMWEWDTTAGGWTKVRTGAEAGMPAIRSYSSMVYDHAHARLLMLAGLAPYNDPDLGNRGFLPCNEVWEIDPEALTFRDRSVAYQGPSARWYHSVAYSPTTGKSYVFGGVDTSGKSRELSDLWEWDGSTWRLVVTDTKPEGRHDAGLAYDPVLHSLILFGGTTFDGSQLTTDTWEWNETTRKWSRHTTNNNPGWRSGHAMVSDTKHNKVLLFGGFTRAALAMTEVWEWDGATLTWTSRTPPPSTRTPARHNYPVVSFDEPRGKLMLFHVSHDPSVEGQSTSAYWEWDGDTHGWELHDPGETLPEASYVYAVYDSIRRRHVLFTDAPDTNAPQTWELDANTETWTTRQPAITPFGRFRAGMAFDSGRRVAVLFGGNVYATSGGGVANDTWEYSVNKLANGEGCTTATAATCASGLCVDGICCATAGCTGPCMACNVRGSEGTCVQAQAGTEVAGSCSNGQACDGSGTCKSKNGQACTAASGCASGFCVDGVCCDKACTGDCKACNLTGHTGTCTPQMAGSDPDGECGQGTGVCKSSCDGVGACSFPLGSPCGTCLVCDGIGACTRTDPDPESGCTGGSGGSGGAGGGGGGKDPIGGKPNPGAGGNGGSVKSSSGSGGKIDPGTGGSSGGAITSSGGKAGSGGSSSSVSSASSAGNLAGAVSSTPSGGGIPGGGSTMVASTLETGSQGGSGGTTVSGSNADAGGGSVGSSTAADAGVLPGDASATDGGRSGKLGSRGCGCDVGQAESARDTFPMWTLLVGVGVLARRSRRRQRKG